MVKVLFGDQQIDIGKGKFIPVKVYCKERGITFQTVDNWIFNGRIQEGEDFFMIPDLDIMLIRDQDHRHHKRLTKQERTEIFELLSKGEGFASIGKKFGITRGAVFHMKSRREQIRSER